MQQKLLHTLIIPCIEYFKEDLLVFISMHSRLKGSILPSLLDSFNIKFLRVSLFGVINVVHFTVCDRLLKHSSLRLILEQLSVVVEVNNHHIVFNLLVEDVTELRVYLATVLGEVGSRSEGVQQRDIEVLLEFDSSILDLAHEKVVKHGAYEGVLARAFIMAERYLLVVGSNSCSDSENMLAELWKIALLPWIVGRILNQAFLSQFLTVAHCCLINRIALVQRILKKGLCRFDLQVLTKLTDTGCVPFVFDLELLLVLNIAQRVSTLDHYDVCFQVTNLVLLRLHEQKVKLHPAVSLPRA